MNTTLKTKDILRANGVKDSDTDLFFTLIDESLKYEGSFNCATQHEEFLKLCYTQSLEKRDAFSNIIGILKRYFYNDNPEFEKLHESNGGIIEGGDDAFYEDFACWLIFRGIEVLDKFFKCGANYLINHIKSLNISNYELTYENFGYYIEYDATEIDTEKFLAFSNLNNDELKLVKASLNTLLRLRDYSDKIFNRA